MSLGRDITLRHSQVGAQFRAQTGARTKAIRSALFAALAAALGIAGCSGSPDDIFFDSNGQTNTQGDSNQPGNPGGDDDSGTIDPLPEDDGGKPKDGGPNPSDAGDGGTSHDSGKPDAVTPPVDSGPEPITCAVGEHEREPNDNRTLATVMFRTFCGELSSASDVDVGALTLPLNATRLTFDYKISDSVLVRVRISGGNRREYKVLPEGDVYPVVPGATYYFSFENPGQTSRAYRFDFQF